jgi:guanylate kinase
VNASILRRGLCLVLAGPSGGGKSSVAQALRAVEPALAASVSVTTRSARPAERAGIDYHFVAQDQFERMVANGELLEWARVLGRYYYGTPRAPVEATLAAGGDMIFDIDWQGYRSLRTALPGDVVGVFLLPPSLSELEARLRGRRGEDEAEIARRMARADDEISHCGEFEHVVVNQDFDETLAAVRAILHAARTATPRLAGLRAYCAAMGAR